MHAFRAIMSSSDDMMFVFVLALCHQHFIVVCSYVDSTSSTASTSINEDGNKACNIEGILGKYPGQLTSRPGAALNITDEVVCAMRSISVDGIDEVNMEFTISVTLEMTWTDRRLRQILPCDAERVSSIRGSDIDRIWVPVLFFPLLKSGSVHAITSTNRVLWFTKEWVYYGTRLTLTQMCNMDLTFFPFDSPKCDTHISTFDYTLDEIHLAWDKDDHIWNLKLNVPRFTHPRLKTSNFTVKQDYQVDGQNFSLTYSALNVSVTMERCSGYYALTQMTSSFLLAVLSWLNYWIDAEQAPARISLGITTVLAAITQVSNARRGLAQVSYNTALDIWLSVCLNITIAGLVEYALVHILAYRAKRLEKHLERRQANWREHTYIGPISQNDRAETFFVHNQRHPAVRRNILPESTTTTIVSPECNSSVLSPHEANEFRMKILRCRLWARRIDVFFRILMPLVLSVFGIVYLIVYNKD